jgi:hypothetical protein
LPALLTAKNVRRVTTTQSSRRPKISDHACKLPRNKHLRRLYLRFYIGSHFTDPAMLQVQVSLLSEDDRFGRHLAEHPAVPTAAGRG